MTESPPPPPPPPPPGGPGPDHLPPSTVSAGSAGAVPRAEPTLADIGEWLTETTRALVARFGELFAALVVITIPTTAVAAPLLWISSGDVLVTRDDDGLFDGIEGVTTAAATQFSVAIAVSLVSQIVVFAVATRHLVALSDGAGLPWHRSLLEGLARTPRLVGLGLVFALLFVVVNAVGGLAAAVGLGVVALPMVFALLAWLWVRGGLAPTHAALSEPGASLTESFAMTRGITVALFGRWIILLTLVITVQLVGTILASPLRWVAGGPEPSERGDLVLRDLIGADIASFLGTQLVSGLVTGVGVSLWAAGSLAIHRRLRQGPDRSQP